MRKLTALPTQRVLRALRRAGWEVYGGAKHYKLLNPTKPGALTVTSAIRGCFDDRKVREEFLGFLARTKEW